MTPTVLLLLVYAFALVAAGTWASRRVTSSSQFFVAGRSLSAGLVFSTLLAANIGAGLGGPGRIRSRSINLSNGFATLP